MIKKKKILKAESMPEFDTGIENMPLDSKIFVDKSLEIADYLQQVMEQKGIKQKDLAEKMGKSEAEVSKLLSGMQNLTLRTVSKLEAALGCSIICTPSKTRYHVTTFQMLKPPKPSIVKKEEFETKGLTYEGKLISLVHNNSDDQNLKII